MSTTARRAPLPPISASLRPIKDGDFGYDQARHLLARAGFGGSPEQIQKLVSWGPAKSVDYLLNSESIPFETVKADLFDKDIMSPLTVQERGALARARRERNEEELTRLRVQRQESQRRDRAQMEKLQRWWLTRMIETPRPLEEKMTLFWHGHFATSYRTIEDSYHMFMQNELFRANAVGNFGKLLDAIIHDPAMLAYLNNNQSRKAKPNENLARELMELFSLGVGNYTERDIKEGARALTGYTFEDDTFEFRKGNHDTGEKYILGRSGRLDGDSFVATILAQPSCGSFITTKLYRFFVSDYPSGRREVDASAKSVLSRLDMTFRMSNYDLKPMLRELFLSEHFYEPAIMAQEIKSPAELVVGAVRSLNTPVRDLGVLLSAMRMMGQDLFFPPNVKGWPGGRMWINTATLFIRQNIACFLLTGKTPRGFDALAKSEMYDPTRLIKELEATRPAGTAGDVTETVENLLRFTLGRVADRNRDLLVTFLRDRLGQSGRLTPHVLVEALLLITAMPEYQLT